MEIKTIFEEAIKEVKEKPSIKVTWHNWFDLDFDPFAPTELKTDEIKKFFVNRTIELKSILKIILSSGKGKSGYVAIVGPKGIGKTTLLNAVNFSLKSFAVDTEEEFVRELKGEFVSFSSLMQLLPKEEVLDYEEDHMFFRWLSEKKDENINFSVFDDCEYHVHSLPIFSRHLPKTWLKIFVLTPIAWRELAKKESNFTENFDNIINIESLSEKNIVLLIKSRLKNNNLFTESSIKKIATSSFGIPKLAIYVARRSMIESSQRSLKLVSDEIVEEVMRYYNLMDLEEITNMLTSTQLKIAMIMLETGQDLTADDVSSYLNIRRPTAVHHLREMRYKNAVYTKREGKKVRYSLKEIVGTIIDLKIQRGEL